MRADGDWTTEKSAVRRRMIALRSALSRHDWELRSRALTAKLLCLDSVVRAEQVMIYLPFVARREVDTSMFMSWLEAEQKTVSVPVVKGKDLVASRFHVGDRIVSGCFGQPEPAIVRPLPVVADVIIVPLVAADRSGTRIGYGAGCYDRFFAALQKRGFTPHAVGICFSFQVLDTLPFDPWDRKLDCIVTEQEVISIQ
ncbi:MAG: 5-formyltetrahydrofolate cyclo-ligase [Prosthecochloris sp.]|uniref:5-formyltetrahydrofolate cyclo-ligase n=1 Tax=Prosthecochloris sp. TaxID=290513 RepID=UPI0013C65478|nr:5-formyltetrahydrofolate cyclo-ligase [Prosthecochloris sp.]NEX11543.1 5-formyltetrahydrofolate cyclo-ligase [Prosthecochloris sp.]